MWMEQAFGLRPWYLQGSSTDFAPDTPSHLGSQLVPHVQQLQRLAMLTTQGDMSQVHGCNMQSN